MAIEKLLEFAKDGQKNTDDLVLTDGFPVLKKPARQWFNWLFNSLTSKVNEIIDADFVPKADIVDNLTTDDAKKPVSAKQAKNLQDSKLDKMANAVSATKLKNARKINNVDFDGTSDITVTDDALTYMPIPYPKSSPPTGYLAMMGQAISESTYPKLYALYGAVLPDMRAYSVRGLDYGRGIDVDRVVLSQQLDDIKSHIHPTNIAAFNTSYKTGSNPGGYLIADTLAEQRRPTLSTGGAETRVKNIAFLYIVKAG